MAKIAIIGAGSIVFTQTFLNDLYQVPALHGSRIALMGPTLSKLEKVRAFALKMSAVNDVPMDVQITDKREEALAGADYVITTLKIGGAVQQFDKSIPLQYGVNQAIGDSLGPGGVFRAARTVPVMLDIARDMERLCPDALLLQYVNPMGMICAALGNNSSIQFSGMCHGIQTTLGLIAAFTDVPKERIDFTCGGINHMAWFLDIRDAGRDLYPLLRERIEQPEYYISDPVRCETMRHFGYFMTESSEHLSEYLPWFRKRDDLLERFCGVESFGRRKPEITAEKGREMARNPIDLLAMEDGSFTPRSDEYCSRVIEAMETDTPFVFNGNIVNRGFIDNLPDGACVEVPIMVNASGLHPRAIGALPSQLAALNMSNVQVQQLAVEAVLQGDPELLFQAVAVDPLTQAVLSLEETRAMVGAMLEAEKRWLPAFAGKSLAPRRAISIPPGTQPIPTPIDPAMAIAHRIAKLFPRQDAR